jgi:hypothetical protein
LNMLKALTNSDLDRQVNLLSDRLGRPTRD